MIIANIADFREAARRRLPRFLFEYIDGGSYSETTLRRNVDDLAGIALRQRVLRDVSQIDLSTELFGAKQAMPVALAPIGLAGLNARRGETQAVRAAEKAGVPFTLSTVSACPLNEVAAAAQRPFWFQLVHDPRPRLHARTAGAGGGGRVQCVGVYRGHAGAGQPLPRCAQRCDGRAGAQGRCCGAPRRPCGVRLGAGTSGSGPSAPPWQHCACAGRGRPGSTTSSRGCARISIPQSPGGTWTSSAAQWRGPLILKGILDPEDAKEAAALGADGLIVSNHGGRQLDGVLSTARALPPIADGRGRAA